MDLVSINNKQNTPSSKDIENIKSQIENEKKRVEYEKLKSDLMDISLKSKYELSEFDGGLKETDTHRILKSKNKKKHFADFFIDGIIKMVSPRPIIRNIIAISLLIATVLCIVEYLHVKEFEPYKLKFCYFLESAIIVQILKSASRSLFIPITSLLIGVVASNIMQPNDILLAQSQLNFQILMIVGALGITISVFTID